MKFTAHLLLLIFVSGCADSKREKLGDRIPQDTVYDGNIIAREKLESKRPTIQLDNGAGVTPTFVVGDTTILRIRIPRLTEYDMHLEQIVGATIIKVDTAHNKFLVIPEENQFSLVVKQYYPIGHVIRYTRNWNEAKADYDEKIVRLDGNVEIAKLEFTAQ